MVPAAGLPQQSHAGLAGGCGAEGAGGERGAVHDGPGWQGAQLRRRSPLFLLPMAGLERAGLQDVSDAKIRGRRHEWAGQGGCTGSRRAAAARRRRCGMVNQAWLRCCAGPGAQSSWASQPCEVLGCWPSRQGSEHVSEAGRNPAARPLRHSPSPLPACVVRGPPASPAMSGAPQPPGGGAAPALNSEQQRLVERLSLGVAG